MKAVHSRSAVAQAPLDFLYVATGAPLGLMWFTVLAVALTVGIGTAVVVVGVPVLAATLLLWRWAANTERERAALVLGAPIPRPPRPSRLDGLVSRWRASADDQRHIGRR